MADRYDELARATVRKFMERYDFSMVRVAYGNVPGHELAEDIANALRQAVEAERAACAEVAGERAVSRHGYDKYGDAEAIEVRGSGLAENERHDMSRKLAIAIWALNDYAKGDDAGDTVAARALAAIHYCGERNDDRA